MVIHMSYIISVKVKGQGQDRLLVIVAWVVTRGSNVIHFSLVTEYIYPVQSRN